MTAILDTPAPQQQLTPKPSLAGLGREGLKGALASIGVPDKQLRMRVGQLWSWLYARGVTSFDDMLNVSKDVRAQLQAAKEQATSQLTTGQQSLKVAEARLAAHLGSVQFIAAACDGLIEPRHISARAKAASRSSKDNHPYRFISRCLGHRCADFALHHRCPRI
jgi:hypothetical protein